MLPQITGRRRIRGVKISPNTSSLVFAVRSSANKCVAPSAVYVLNDGVHLEKGVYGRSPLLLKGLYSH